MPRRLKRWPIGLFLLVIIAYGAIAFRNLNESGRRSLSLRESPVKGDSVAIAVRVVSVDPSSSEVTARISFRLAGTLAQDRVTPAVDLKFFVNDIRGGQEIQFPRGRRMDSIERVFPFDGNVNQYPIDRYETQIRMLMTKQSGARSVRRQTPAAVPTVDKPGEKVSEKPGTAPDIEEDLLVAAPLESETVEIVSSLEASIPGLKFEGAPVGRQGNGAEGFNLSVRRADNVIVVSIMIMLLMMSLAMSILLMGLQALSSGEQIELLPLSLSVSLLFGLPALRNAQPAVPALGVFGDYLSFIWAELIVAVSAVVIIWTWLMRKRHATGDSSEETGKETA
jgi:hypothetical protein